jgi:hypothetical protein
MLDRGKGHKLVRAAGFVNKTKVKKKKKCGIFRSPLLDPSSHKYYSSYSLLFAPLDVGTSPKGVVHYPLHITRHNTQWYTHNTRSENITLLKLRTIYSLINLLRGLSPRANYADRATAACWRS